MITHPHLAHACRTVVQGSFKSPLESSVPWMRSGKRYTLLNLALTRRPSVRFLRATSHDDRNPTWHMHYWWVSKLPSTHFQHDTS